MVTKKEYVVTLVCMESCCLFNNQIWLQLCFPKVGINRDWDLMLEIRQCRVF